MNKHLFKIRTSVVMGIMILFSTIAFGQEYQKAKDVLRAITIKDAILYQIANSNSKKIIQIPRSSTVFVFGKKGNFLDMKYQNLRGWGIASSFSILGVANVQQPQEAAPVKVIEAEQSVMQEPARLKDTAELPIRVNPYVTYVMKGKSFYKQLRGGVEATYAISDHIAMGAVTDLVFLKGKYLDFGPVLRNEWSNQSAFFNPSILIGLLYYTFDHDTDKDSGFGLQWAIQNEIPIMKDSPYRPSITTKIGADMMFFYFDQVRIPYWLSVGAAFRF